MLLKHPDSHHSPSQSASPLLSSAGLPKHKLPSVNAGVIHTALRVCQQYLGVLEHRDIDVTAETDPEVSWGTFLQDYYKVVQ